MKALVIGGAGFIGSNLSRKLYTLGWELEIVDNFSSGRMENLKDLSPRNITSFMLPAWNQLNHRDGRPLLIHADMEDPHVLARIQEERYDVIFLLAANPRVEDSIQNPVNTTDNNCTRTLQVFHAVEKLKKRPRIVFSSSSAVYGEEVNLPTKETEVRKPNSPYGLQKVFMEEYARISSKIHGIDVVSLRYFNVYGPYQYGNSAYATAVSAWCHALKFGEPLRSDGTGNQSRDMIFVDDVVEANLLAASRFEPFQGECINIGTGNFITNNQILSLLKEKFPDLKIVNAPSRPGDVFKTQANLDVAYQKLGFTAKITFQQGLEKTLQWWNLLSEDKNEE